MIWICCKCCSEVHEQALLSCDAIHHERRILLKQEIGRMVLFFTDQPSLLAPNIQVFKVIVPFLLLSFHFAYIQSSQRLIFKHMVDQICYVRNPSVQSQYKCSSLLHVFTCRHVLAHTPVERV